MEHQVVIRQAQLRDIDWVNQQYRSIGFKESEQAKEYIVIAEVDGQKSGLGRLQNIGNGQGELGGIYVNEGCRGLGLANRIVDSLLNQSGQYQQIYCLPYAHLQGFYERFGFMPLSEKRSVPACVLEKHDWCNDTYEYETLLLMMTVSKSTKVA